MSKLLIPSVVALAAMCASTAHAAIDLDPLLPTYSVSVIDKAYFKSGANSDQSIKVYEEAFGTTTFGNASTTIGSVGSAPFIIIGMSSSSTMDVSYTVNAALDYSWRIVGAPNTPVLVHITTSGWIKSFIDYLPKDPTADNSPLNAAGTVATASFNTYTSDGPLDQRTYGLQTSPYNFGGESVSPTYNGTASTVDASFTKTFDLWVMPNMPNTVKLQASGNYSPRASFIDVDLKEFYSAQAFIDPTITIDAAYAGDYTLEQSYIPAASVPEPESCALFFAGLAVIGASAARRARQSGSV